MDAGGDARLHLTDDLFQQQRGLGLVVAVGGVKLGRYLLLHDPGHDGLDRRGAEDFLRLALKLRLGEPDGQDRGEPGEDVVLLDFVVSGLQFPRVGFHGLPERLDERLLEAGLVGAALRRGNDVHEAADAGVVADPPAQCDVHFAIAFHFSDLAVALLIQDGDGFLEVAGPVQAPDVRDTGVGGEELDELGDTAVVVEYFLVRPHFPRRARELALITEGDFQAGNQEGGLPRARRQFLVGKAGVRGEDLGIRPVTDARAGHAALGFADHVEDRVLDERGERGGGAGPAVVIEAAGFAAAERHLVRLAAPVNLGVETGRERVDDGGADAVQAAGGGVGTAAELAARVQFGEDHLDAGEPGFGFDVDGNAAAVVVDLD